MKRSSKEVWLVSGRRTPFVKIDREFKEIGAIALSVPVVQQMIQEQGVDPDFLIWGTVAPKFRI